MDDLYHVLADIDRNGRLEYTECARLYRYWPLGKRLAERIVSKAFSVEREISFGDGVPPEVIEEFKRVSKETAQDEAIKQAAILARIYGQAVLYAASDKEKLSDPLTNKKTQNGRLKFKAGDPLAIQVTVNQNPQLLNFLYPERVEIGGSEISPQRATVLMNGIPMYLQYSGSSYSYGGRSVYENQLPIIRAWAKTLRSMGRISDRASGIYAFFSRFKKGGLEAHAAQKSLELVKTLSDTGGVAMGADDRVEVPTTSGIGDLEQLMQRIEREVVTASDTPLSVLLDERLANGFGNGTEDFKTIIQDIDAYRNQYLRPLYEFSDIFVMWRAFTKPFLKKIIAENPEYQGYTPTSLRMELINNFSFEFGNLYPASKKEKAETKSLLLDVAAKAVSVGVTSSDIETFLNDEKVMGKDVTVTSPIFPEEEEEIVP